MSALSLLYAMMLPSADDAAEDLAYNVGRGSVSRFIGWMNADARRLGLRNTHYTTPIGLDTPGNYSSANDLVHLAAYMIGRYALFRRIVDTDRATVWDAAHTIAYVLVNTDDLIARDSWITGVKTGHTGLAGYLLVSAAERDGLRLVAAVLGADSAYARDQNMLALLDWGLANFARVAPVRAGQVFARRRVPYELLPAPVVAARGYSTVLARGTPIHLVIGRIRPLTPPMAAGTPLGTLRIRIAGRPTVRVRLILGRALHAVPAIKKVVHVLRRPITLLLLALPVGAAVMGALTVLKGRRNDDEPEFEP